MKICFLALGVLLGSCSSTSNKEFTKSLDKPVEALPEVQVEAPKGLLEKFEVAKVETPAPAPALAVKPEKKKSAPVVVKALPAPPAPPRKMKAPLPVAQSRPLSKLPKDYPPELLNINRRAESVWKNYRSNHVVNDKVILDIHYLGMTVGKIMVTNRGKDVINGKEVWHFHSRFKSAPFYSSIYELDDTVDTYVTTDQFLSVRYSLIQRESKQDIDDLQLHDRDQMKTFWFFKQKKSNGDLKNKEKESFIPYFSIDPFSVVFFYQGLPMKDGDVYEIPIVNKAKILMLRSKVEGREKIDTEKRRGVRAIRLHATTQYTGETLKSGDLTFWFSDDERRTLLKAKAKIQLGSVTADVVDN